MLFDEEGTRRRLWNWCLHHTYGDDAETWQDLRDELPLANVMRLAETLEARTRCVSIPAELVESAAQFIELPQLEPERREQIIENRKEFGFIDPVKDLKYPGAYAFPDALYEIDE